MMIAMTKWSGKETIPNSSVDIDIVIVGINGKSSSRSNMFIMYGYGKAFVYFQSIKCLKISSCLGPEN